MIFTYHPSEFPQIIARYVQAKWQYKRLAMPGISDKQPISRAEITDGMEKIGFDPLRELLHLFGIFQYISDWWFGTFFIFPYIGNVIIPTDFHIFQTGWNHQPEYIWIPSGKLSQNYGKSPFFMGKSTINGDFQ